MEECIFCKLLEENSKILYKDSTCFVVLDKYPIEEGHLLVISNKHYENMLDAPDATVSNMFVVAKMFGQKLKEAFGANSINIGTNIGRLAGQRVMHFHIHVIPRYEGKGRSFSFGHNKELSAEEEQELMAKLKL
ncbi:MAG: HIT family protein [Candidatus Micrarchaeaceae archaeon]